jgi:hypothetical protein
LSLISSRENRLLRIRKKGISKTYLQILKIKSYIIVGLIYLAMGDLNKALEFLSKGLEIDKKHLKKKN